MRRRSLADTFLSRFRNGSDAVETRLYAQIPGLRAARHFGFVKNRPAVGRGWRHELTDAGKVARDALVVQDEQSSGALSSAPRTAASTTAQ